MDSPLRDMKVNCSVCGKLFEQDEHKYISCEAHSFGETEEMQIEDIGKAPLENSIVYLEKQGYNGLAKMLKTKKAFIDDITHTEYVEDVTGVSGYTNDLNYQVVYADPPWRYGDKMLSNKVSEKKVYYPIEKNYPTLSLADICMLPVKSIVAEDAVLFIWTTDSHIPEALKVIEAWGFEYKTVGFYWLKKEKSGKQVFQMGRWTVKSGEMCLMATRGKMMKHLLKSNVHQLTEAKRDRKKHSGKPSEVRDKIVEMFGDLKKIELFSREKVDGWHSWGNEVESDITL